MRGNPPWRFSDAINQVYPRVCGGTLATMAKYPVWRGLSPRMRGNPPSELPLSGPHRSIPAYAGEPIAATLIAGNAAVYPRVCGGTGGASSRPGMRGVYPRVCGGTFAGVNGGAAAWGLSPRMRGNPPSLSPASPTIRSIPAYAGEPRVSIAAAADAAVYPRVCGGTPTPTGSAIPA